MKRTFAALVMMLVSSPAFAGNNQIPTIGFGKTADEATRNAVRACEASEEVQQGLISLEGLAELRIQKEKDRIAVSARCIVVRAEVKEPRPHLYFGARGNSKAEAAAGLVRLCEGHPAIQNGPTIFIGLDNAVFHKINGYDFIEGNCAVK